MRIDEKIQAAIMLFLLAIGVLTVAPVLFGDRVVEPFSELGILGPGMMLGDYPNQVISGERVDLFLYLGNHEGRIMYYRVDVRLGDQSINVSDTQPYPGQILTSYKRVLPDEANITVPIWFNINESGENRRVVFELYKYHSDTRDFRYDGNWVQLWMNVTETG